MPQPSMISYGYDVVDRMVVSRVTARGKGEHPRKLYRVEIRCHGCLCCGAEHRAKVVAPDILTAVDLTVEAAKVDPSKLDGVAVTLLCEDCELAEGEVFDRSHRSRGFGERGGWRPDLPASTTP